MCALNFLNILRERGTKLKSCWMDPSMYKVATSGDFGFLQLIRVDEVSSDLLSHKTPEGNNILHLAAEFKKIDFFKGVPSFEKGFPLLWDINKMGDTPLHIAARVGCVELVDFLIDRAKMLHVQRSGDQERGPTYAESYKKLLRKTNLEMHTALHVAARYGHRRVVISLMKADPELCCSTNSTKESPLFLATCKGFSNIAGDILKEPSISPSFQGINGVTALHAAVTHTYQGAEEIVKIMMSKYPDMIKEADALGWTPLHYAAFRGNDKAVTLLMESDKSSTSYISDKCGMTALHVAAYKGHIEVMKKLIQYQPDTCECLNAKDQTILHVAVLGAQSDVVKYILELPELPRLIDQADKEGYTPLHLAVMGQKHEITRMLKRDCGVDNTSLDKGFSLVFDNFLGEDTKIQTASALCNRKRADPNLSSNNKAEQDGEEGISVRVGEEGSSVILGKGSSVILGRYKLVLEENMDNKVNEQEMTESSHPGRSFGVPSFQEQISRDFKKFESHPDDKDSGTSAVAGKPEKEKSDVHLLIATLIATVAFAAGLAPPGGYGPDGKIILQDNTNFKWFFTLNVISFLLSSLVLIRESGPCLGSRLSKVLGPLLFALQSETIIAASLYGMLLAFWQGTTAGLNKTNTSIKSTWPGPLTVAAGIALMMFGLGPGLFQACSKTRDALREKRSDSVGARFRGICSFWSR